MNKTTTAPVRLEYSATQGFLNYGNPDHSDKNTNTFFCLADSIPLTQASQFTQRMVKKYPSINSGKPDACPTYDVIKQEYKNFRIKK